VKVRFIETIKQTIFVSEEHHGQSNRCKESDNGLKSNEESSEEGSFYNI